MGIKQPSVSKWKKKDIFPESWAYKIAKEFNLDVDWILTGEGKVCSDQELDTFLKMLSEWVEEVSGSGNKEWFINQVEDSFPRFKAWKQRKEDSESDSVEFPNSKAV